jgi:hypothetical protein
MIFLADFLMQFFVAFIIGFGCRWKTFSTIFVTFWFVLFVGLLFFDPVNAGVTLHEGLFTWWRWVASFAGYFLGLFIANEVFP